METDNLSFADHLKADFPLFIRYVWKHVLMLPPPTRTQLDIADYLATGPRRRFLEAFRGVGKSFLTCGYVVWKLWNDPQLKILIVSANEDGATKNANLIKQIIDHEAGDDLWADLRSRRDQRSSTLSFDVGPALPDKQPSVSVTGIFGQLPGNRADILIPDDIENDKNSATEAQRERLKAQTSEFSAILKPLPTSEIIYLGTPQTEESTYKDLASRGYGIRIWPARYPLVSKLHTYDGALAPMLRDDILGDGDLCKPIGSSLGGAPTDPARFDENTLQLVELDMRAAAFMLQMQLDTSLSDAERYPLKTSDFIVMDVDPRIAPVQLSWASGPEQIIKDLQNVGFNGDRFHRPMYVSAKAFENFTGAVMHIDPSGKGKDETAYCVTKFLKGMVYIRRWGGLPGGYDAETLERLATIAAEEQVNEIVVESNFGDGMFEKLLEPVLARKHPCRITGERASGQKEKRILNVLEPALKQHRLVIDTTVVRADLAHPQRDQSGLYQLTHLTEARGSLKHDDRIDVLAASVGHWTKYLNADVTKAEEAWKRKQDEEFEKRFFAGTIIGDRIAKGGRRRAVGRRMR